MGVKKYQVRWETHGSEPKLHGIYNSLDEAVESINHWWDLNDFTPPYVRMWTKGRTTTIDYGLHEAFYRIVELDSGGMRIQETIWNNDTDAIYANIEEIELEEEILSTYIDILQKKKGKLQSCGVNLNREQMRELGSWLIAMSEL